MVGPYPSLPREVAATVPRRAPLRHSWVREDPLSHPSHPSHPAPLKVEVSPYSPAPQDTPSTPGHVSRARALFESPQDMHPSSPRRKDTPGNVKDTPKMSLNTTEDEAVTPVTPKNTFVTPFTPDTATKITLRVHPYIYTHPAPSRRYTQGPPLVDEFGELITTPATPQRLMTVKKVTPIIIPRITPVRTSPQPVSHQETPQLASPQCTHAPQHCTPPRAQTTGTWDVGGDWGRGRGDEVGRTARTQQTNSTSVPKTVYRATPPPRHPHALPIAMLESPPTSHPPFHPHPYASFSQIPLDLLECLEESSVDPPTPPDGVGGVGTGPGVTAKIKEAPASAPVTVTPPCVTPTSLKCEASPPTPTPTPESTPPPEHPQPPQHPPSTPSPQPSPPATLIRENFRGFCSDMLKNTENDHSHASHASYAHARSLDEELWAAGVYFRRPGSPPRPVTSERRQLGRKVTSSLRSDVIVECALEESVLRELDSSLAGLGVSSSSSSGSSSSSSGSSSSTPCPVNPEPLNLIEEVLVKKESLSSFSPPPSPPPPASPSPPPPPPPSTVTLKAFYQYPSPPPPPAPLLDSDSGHESGATSPCGTLTGEDVNHTPPASPYGAHSPHQDMGVGVAVVGEDSRGVGVGGVSLEPRPPSHFVVVAIDFGTTFSGYAFSFTNDPESVHMMKQWQGGDPGVQNQKTPTTLLVTPEGAFHSLGYQARDTYHDLDPQDAATWMYFDRFKMVLHADQTLSRDTLIEATNGRRLPALQVFSYALRYFRDHALRELSDQAGVCGGVGVLEEDVRWVITVPAIWSHPAKQFMRSAAYQAGMASPTRPDQLLIALEPEVAAIYCRRLKRHQLLPASSSASSSTRSLPPHLQDEPAPPPSPDLDRAEVVSLPYRSLETVADWLAEDTVYAVVDCGGGTVDITVHQMTDRVSGHLKELHKATGGPHGSTGVDAEFEKLLEKIFTPEFLETFKRQRPAAHVDLMIAFEARKRNASPRRATPLNIALPFSFIDLYRKIKGRDVESAVRKHQHLGVRWSSQGMLRLEPETMKQLFIPTLTSITKAIEEVLLSPDVQRLQYMFLVGGFAESELLQTHIRNTFSSRVRVVIPQGTSLAILRGAVQFGLDPGIVTVRRSRLTYGVGVLNKYDPLTHPEEKRVTSGGGEWCADILDRFVVVDQSVAVGDVVVRSYTPATHAQRTVILHLYATDRHDAQFVTEEGVERVGTLHLDLGPPLATPTPHKAQERPRREISVNMKFGETEVKATAVDHQTRRCVKADIDFLTL